MTEGPLWLVAAIVLATLAIAGCSEVPTGVRVQRSPLSPSSAFPPSDDQSSVIRFETLSYDGVESDGDRLSLDVSILDAAGVIGPSERGGIMAPTDFEELQFFGPDVGKGEWIEGAGLLRSSALSVDGFGRLVDVPVTGSRTRADGTVEPVQGTLTIDLTEDVVEPLKGDFFSTCGSECLRFDIQATFEETAGPTPCLLTGAFTAES